MIWFSQRKAIEDAFNKWAEENGVAKVPNAVVAFLQINGCLNEDAIMERFAAKKLKPPFTVREHGINTGSPVVEVDNGT